MIIEIRHDGEEFCSYRSARVKSLFNATSAKFEHTANLPIEDMDWQIGVIVGPSGSGKSSIGKKIFSSGIYDLYANWPKDIPIVDAIAPDASFDSVTGALAAVGLGDVPAWLRPFNVLSNGEQFRAGLARLINERPSEVVVDEFTSVVDRQIAKVGAYAFGKAWRKGKGKIVLLTPHYDILEWLQPDWVYDTKEARFSRDCLRRPAIRMDIYKVKGTLWKYYKQHYYLDLPMPVAAEYFVGVVNGELVNHLAVSPLFTAKAYRATRLVTMPEWQGCGAGTAFLNEICRLHLEGKGRCGKNYPTLFHTSHPQLCGYLRQSRHWRQVSAKLYGGNKVKSNKSLQNSIRRKGGSGISALGYGGHFRAIQGFKFMGNGS